VTDEESGVSAFAVSPADGSLAYVSDNQLFLVDGRSAGRTLVADGGPEEVTSDLMFHNTVGAVSFAPDGRTLAYGLDGLHLYDVASGRDQHVLANGESLPGEPRFAQEWNYGPGDWSPDGSRLVVHAGYVDIGRLAVMKPGADQPFTWMRSTEPVDGKIAWSSDSRWLYLANPNFGVSWPGLWRYDPETGEETPLVTTQPGASHYVGWPVQLGSGDLIYFHGERFSPDEGIPLVMVRSDASGQSRTAVRTEEFHVMDALWTTDGSLVLISQVTAEGVTRLVLARPDGSPLQVVGEGGLIRRLAWGP
jgi:Tol biopolymer transport system component